MSSDQQALPGTRGPEPERKARVFLHGKQWVVTVPTQFGRPIRYETPTFPGAIRFLDHVTKRRKRQG